MAHTCPDCDETCYCHGDIDDTLLGTLNECEHPRRCGPSTDTDDYGDEYPAMKGQR